MIRAGKPIPELHIPFASLSVISVSDLLAIDGPKFITSGSEAGAHVYAVIISHAKWRALSHNLPEVDPHIVTEFYVAGQAYLAIPVEREEGSSTVWQAKPETGMIFVAQVPSRREAASGNFGICPECGANTLKRDVSMSHKSVSGRIMPGHKEEDSQ